MVYALISVSQNNYLKFFNWVAACEFESAENMKEAKDEITEYFLKEYKQMLEQHIDSHIEAFEFK